MRASSRIWWETYEAKSPGESVSGGIVANVDDLVQAMEAAATPENARVLARYFKVAPGSYGEGDIFLGLKLSELRQALHLLSLRT